MVFNLVEKTMKDTKDEIVKEFIGEYRKEIMEESASIEAFHDQEIKQWK